MTSTEQQYVTLSSNEVEQLIQAKCKANRIARLLETRKQAKNQAAKLREDYKQKKRDQKEQYLNESKSHWEEERRNHLLELEKELQVANHQVGNAYVDARQWNEQAYEFAQQQQQLRKECTAREQKRFRNALQQQRYDHHKQSEPKVVQQSIKNQVRAHENKISRDVVVQKHKREAMESRSTKSNFQKAIHKTKLNDFEDFMHMKASRRIRTEQMKSRRNI